LISSEEAFESLSLTHHCSQFLSGGGLRSNSSAPEFYPLGRSVHFDWKEENPNLIMAGASAAAANAPSIVPEVWTDNPFTANFNPGTPAGSKIFLKKSKGPVEVKRVGDTITNSIANSKKFHGFLKTKTNTFGTCCSRISIEFSYASESECDPRCTQMIWK
jgi:hypothetical protein